MLVVYRFTEDEVIHRVVLTLKNETLAIACQVFKPI
jgi:hypothetical protein